MAEDMRSRNFTCITCRVVFVDAEMQRDHYKTDWHRYNLKRKVAELPPVSAENFQDRILSHKAMMEAEEGAGKQSNYCKLCKKHFSTVNSYESHVRSKKHREQLLKLGHEEETGKVERLNKLNSDDIMEHGEGRDGEKRTVTSTKEGQVNIVPCGDGIVDEKSDDGDDDSWEDVEVEGLDVTDCLFCPHTSGDLEVNLDHMSRSHGFFLPDAEYLVDMKGLVRYLGNKVGIDYVCLYCGDHGRRFHSLEAVQKHMVDKGHAKIMFSGDNALEFADFYDYRTSYPDHPSVGEDEEEMPDSRVCVNDNLELVLPSGVTLGHRSLKHYYKQNLSLSKSQAIVPSSGVHRVLAQYKAIGYTGPSAAELETRVIRGEAFRERMHKEKALCLGLKGNKLQHHYRSQTGY
jgi:pre-60S factor REI1